MRSHSFTQTISSKLVLKSTVTIHMDLARDSTPVSDLVMVNGLSSTETEDKLSTEVKANRPTDITPSICKDKPIEISISTTSGALTP